ncbi:hypothetical protein N658DRAFT_85507 [Parathielavia hyrcaniae]|uniref:Uncharacterized protein n=1 Tax=Parathielavia hyrcaniae TaxID=113614 RepID=A0AAN6Q4K5_9PEZI|nr:hypothetical protein N658DRAFT_85507 [Parathielavia hyrcaniae]
MSLFFYYYTAAIACIRSLSGIVSRRASRSHHGPPLTLDTHLLGDEPFAVFSRSLRRPPVPRGTPARKAHAFCAIIKSAAERPHHRGDERLVTEYEVQPAFSTPQRSSPPPHRSDDCNLSSGAFSWVSPNPPEPHQAFPSGRVRGNPARDHPSFSATSPDMAGAWRSLFLGHHHGQKETGPSGMRPLGEGVRGRGKRKRLHT